MTGFWAAVVTAAFDTTVVVAGDAVTGGGTLLSAVAWALIDGVGVGVGVFVGVGDGVTDSVTDVDGITDVSGGTDDVIAPGAGTALFGATTRPTVPSAKPEATKRTAPPRVLLPNQVLGRFHLINREAPVATGIQPNAHTAPPKDDTKNSKKSAPAPIRPNHNCHPVRIVYIRSPIRVASVGDGGHAGGGGCLPGIR